VNGDAPETATHLRSVVGAPRAGCRYTHDSVRETVVIRPLRWGQRRRRSAGRICGETAGPSAGPDPYSVRTRQRGREPTYADIAQQLGVAHRKIERAVMSGVVYDGRRWRRRPAADDRALYGRLHRPGGRTGREPCGSGELDPFTARQSQGLMPSSRCTRRHLAVDVSQQLASAFRTCVVPFRRSTDPDLSGLLTTRLLPRCQAIYRQSMSRRFRRRTHRCPDRRMDAVAWSAQSSGPSTLSNHRLRRAEARHRRERQTKGRTPPGSDAATCANIAPVCRRPGLPHAIDIERRAGDAWATVGPGRAPPAITAEQMRRRAGCVAPPGAARTAAASCSMTVSKPSRSASGSPPTRDAAACLGSAADDRLVRCAAV